VEKKKPAPCPNEWQVEPRVFSVYGFCMIHNPNHLHFLFVQKSEVFSGPRDRKCALRLEAVTIVRERRGEMALMDKIKDSGRR